MAALAGRDVRIKIGSTLIAGARVDNETVTREHIDITDKSDAGLRTFLAAKIGIMSGSFTVSGVMKDAVLMTWAHDPDEVLKTLTMEIPGIGSVTGLFGISSFAPGGNDGAEAATFEATFETSGAFPFVPEAAPTNTLLPSISGTAQEGETLTAIPGVWTGAPTFAYQWQEDDSGWANITGAIDQTFVPAAGNVGNALRVIVTATNSVDSVPATSAPTADVLAE